MRGHALGQFSVERVFRDVVSAMPAGIDAMLVEVPYPSRGLLPRLRNMLFTARLQADVVHITGDIQYCALAVRRSRCLLTVLDLGSLRRLTGWRRRLLLLLWYRLPILRAAAVTTISRAICDELDQLLAGAGSKTTVIGCPVGQEFAPSPGGMVKPPCFRVLLVGTTPNKNMETVAAALQGLPIHIRIVGNMDDKQRAIMARLHLSYSQVAGLSHSEMVATYQSSSVLLFASTYEGFGLPILEAQACGLPVVTSSVSPMCDVAGDAAVLVDPLNAASIRHGVEAVLSDPDLRSRLSAAGQLNAANYTPTRVAAEYADAYRRLVSGDP